MKNEPFVPESARLPEFTLRAVLLGVLLAVLFGAANAYLGMKAGQTIAATFPGAVISMVLLRAFKGSTILEENVSRSAASVGEALVAGAIFTLPAFVITGLWKDFNYWQSSFLMLVGGLLGILFVIFLRRTLTEDETLPFPEAVAAAQIHKAGQHGATGAKFLFSTMGFAGFVELLKNDWGFTAIKSSISGFVNFQSSKVRFLRQGQPFGDPGIFHGGVRYQTPYASPAFMSVGYIIGPKLSALNFSGGVLAWLILVPLIMFLSGEGSALMNLAHHPSLADASEVQRLDTVAEEAWQGVVRPMAVGTMLISALWTLFKMRGPLLDGVARAFRDMKKASAAGHSAARLEHDVPMGWVIAGIVLILIPMTALFAWYTGGIGGAFVAAVAMTLTGFVLSAVAGYLVGVIGSSSSPVSGLALSSLIVAALLLVAIGVKGPGGVMAVLAVAAVVCCATSIGGGVIQDLKVGHILGATPWTMEVAYVIAVICTSFVLVLPIASLHAADILKGGSGIGGPNFPAPQAGLMAMLAQGIVGGEMAWPLVLMGIGLGIGLIMMGCESPMIVAVGMYLDLATVSSIFVGGVIRWIADQIMARRRMQSSEVDFRVNVGTLLASGMIAGEAIIAVLLAVTVLLEDKLHLSLSLPKFEGSAAAGLLVFAAVAAILIIVPLRAKKSAALSVAQPS
jgi:putative OPT family oligopeptide transporter